MRPERVVRPRRSLLFVPGSRQRALDKALTLPADGLIFDLEDSVPPAARPAARERVRAALGAPGDGGSQRSEQLGRPERERRRPERGRPRPERERPRPERVVRINRLADDDGRRDLAALAGCALDAVLLPKVESAAEVTDAIAAMDEAGIVPTAALWIMAETPRGVLSLDEICGAAPRLACVVVGAEDLSAGLRVPVTAGRLGLLHVLSHCVLVARAHGLAVLDAVCPLIEDGQGLERLCEQGRNLGFDGKTLVHPSQVEAANRIFRPQPDELAAARAMVAAWENRTDDAAVVVVAGRMIEHLHLGEARRLLALEEVIAAEEQWQNHDAKKRQDDHQ